MAIVAYRGLSLLGAVALEGGRHLKGPRHVPGGAAFTPRAPRPGGHGKKLPSATPTADPWGRQAHLSDPTKSGITAQQAVIFLLVPPSV